MSFTHALKWSFLSELAAKAIQPVVFIVLARLLTPEDFGVMTAAMMVIAFSQIFWEAGMGKALIQRQTHIKEAANAAFMINIGLGILIAGLLFLFAQTIAEIFFQDDRVTAVLQVMTLQVLLGALGSVQTALLQKEMGFKKLFWVRFATVSMPGLASIPLALNGWGYWALVAGTLAGQFAQVLMLWRISHWRPGFKRDSVVTKEISKFGGWVGATGLLAWFYVWADSMVVGHYLGTFDLGLFNMGGKLPAIVFAMIFGPILPVLYSQLSLIGSAQERMKKLAELAIVSLTLVAVPIAITLYVFSKHIELVVFGDRWIGVGIVIAFMSITHGYSWIIGMNGEFYRALGKPNYETIVTSLTLLLYLAVYLWVINKGLEKFVMARAAVMFVGLSLQLMLVKVVLGVNIFPTIRKILIITVVSVVIITLSKEASIFLSNPPTVQLTIGLLFAGAFMAIALYTMERDATIKELISLTKHKRDVI
jgi:O-antigen/teichoic acid export membrane protein